MNRILLGLICLAGAIKIFEAILLVSALPVLIFAVWVVPFLLLVCARGVAKGDGNIYPLTAMLCLVGALSYSQQDTLLVVFRVTALWDYAHGFIAFEAWYAAGMGVLAWYLKRRLFPWYGFWGLKRSKSGDYFANA